MSMILTSCFPARSTTTKTTRGYSCFPVIFLPWILAGIALVLLGVDLSGF